MAEKAEALVRQGPPVEQERATWTLSNLAVATAECFEHVASISYETVRRLLKQRQVTYRRAKEWLTSPDPWYALRKSQRDRLLRLARASAEGAAVWLDQSWFVRWPYQFWAWSAQDDPPRVAKRWQETVDTTAVYAALDDETQEAFLSWAEGQPNSEVTVDFLADLMSYWAKRNKQFIVLFWDKASWHTSKRTRQWIRDYNQRAKQKGLTRLIVCQQPSRSPWLMPLESIFGWIKHQVLGDRSFETISELQTAVEHCFSQRTTVAKERRAQAWAKSLEKMTQKSMSVV